MLFFSDSAERAIVQATMMGGVAVVITSTLLLLWFLDNPYQPGVGGLRPTAMQRTLGLLTIETGIAGGPFAPIPCDRSGVARNPLKDRAVEGSGSVDDPGRPVRCATARAERASSERKQFESAGGGDLAAAGDRDVELFPRSGGSRDPRPQFDVWFRAPWSG